MTKRKKKTVPILVVVLLLGLAALVMFNLPKPVQALDTAFDLLKMADGTYAGSCDNGLVKVRLEVVIENHAITQVRLLKHDNGLGSAAEAITDTVVQRQSVEVDAISGATMSSKTILKAVETALTEGKRIR